MFAVTERRWARRGHLCSTCDRCFDEENYSRTFIAEGPAVSVLIECRDCRPIH